MTCEVALDRLLDFVLDTLSELEAADVHRHLRGCAGCRAEARKLDDGVGLYAEAGHVADPPAELRGRVMNALAEEWAAAPGPVTVAPRLFRPPARWLTAAAAAIIVGASLSWAGIAQHRAATSQAAIAGYQHNAESYQRFLHTLGGKDVRSTALKALAGAAIQGSVVIYDSDKGQSWVGVIVSTARPAGPLRVTLSSRSGSTLRLAPIRLDGRGGGWTWLVTSANLSAFRTVQLSAPDGRLVAQGTLG
jgi:anti-sigma factor RsiW